MRLSSGRSDSRAIVIIRICLVTAGLASLAGCYEGWRRPNAEGSGGGGGGAEKGESQRPYGLAIVDVFAPNREAMIDPACGGAPSSLAELRLQEIEDRRKSVVAAARDFADVIKAFEITIAAEDCANLRPVDARAATSRLDVGSIPEAVRAKPVLHVRAAIWFGTEPRAVPSWRVISPDWADERSLGSQGFGRSSPAYYFALSGSRSGYFSAWRSSESAQTRYDAPTVDAPSPGVNGSDELDQSVREGGAGFRAFLRERASSQ